MNEEMIFILFFTLCTCIIYTCR